MNDDWRSIETAPRDGTIIKDYEGGGDTFPLFVRESDFLKTGLESVRPVSEWKGRDK